MQEILIILDIGVVILMMGVWLCELFNQMFDKRIYLDTKIFYTGLSSLDILAFLLSIENNYGCNLSSCGILGDAELTVAKICHSLNK